MREIPILFSGPMVRAIIEGRKTMTRRVVKPYPIHLSIKPIPADLVARDSDTQFVYRSTCQYGQPGDTLWVRETFYTENIVGCDSHGNDTSRRDIFYRASSHEDQSDAPITWKPSIFMPRWASRITLRVTGVRVERLQEITEADARAEGTTPSVVGDDLQHLAYRAGFLTLWDGINAERGYGWAVNPLVWVVWFEVVEVRK